MNIPRKKLATCLVKCKEREVVERCILTKGLHLFKPQKCVSDRSEELHFCPPILAFKRP